MPQASPLDGHLACMFKGLGYVMAWGFLGWAGVAIAGLLRACKTPAFVAVQSTPLPLLFLIFSQRLMGPR